MATYPVGIKTFVNPQPTDLDTDPPHATQHSDANDEINAIETELGANPSGTFLTVAERLADVDAGISTVGTSVSDVVADLSTTDANVAAHETRLDDHDLVLADLPGVYEPIGQAATEVGAHESEVTPHTSAGYIANKVWNGTAWVLLGGTDIYTQASGDPDPTPDMNDGDIVIVL